MTQPEVAEPEAPESGTSALEYLEKKCAEQSAYINKLESILLLYREHSHALADLTATVFPPKEKPDA